MVVMIKKYTIEEFKAYGKSGSIAQEALSSIRTVLSLGVHKKISKTYGENLKLAEKMAVKKGLLSGLFGGLSSGFFNVIFAVGVFYGKNLFEFVISSLSLIVMSSIIIKIYNLAVLTSIYIFTQRYVAKQN